MEFHVLQDCVTQLNRLFRDNEKLELEIIGLESKLKGIEFVILDDDKKEVKLDK